MSLPPAEKTAAFLQKKTVLAKGGCASFFSFLFHLRLLKVRRFNPSAPGASLLAGWPAALPADLARGVSSEQDKARPGAERSRYSSLVARHSYPSIPLEFIT